MRDTTHKILTTIAQCINHSQNPSANGAPLQWLVQRFQAVRGAAIASRRSRVPKFVPSDPSHAR